MGLENAPKMSRPTDAEITGARPGIDPQRPRPKFRSAGAWALGLGIPAMCYWHIAPIVIVIAVVGITQASRTGDRRDGGYAAAGLCLALLGLLLAGGRLLSGAVPTP
jgi:hypothetical protein